MLNISGTLRLNQSAINRLTRNNIKALEMTGEALKGDVINEQVVPFDSGATQGNIFVNTSKSHLGVVSLDSTLSYSRRIYFHPEYNFQKTKNANAQGLWYDMYIKGRKRSFCQDTFIKFSRRLNSMGGV